MSHSSLTVPRGQCAQSDKITEITPSLQAAAEVRTGGWVLSVQERVWVMSQQVFCAPQGWGVVPGKRWLAAAEGLLPVKAQRTQLADPPLGQERSWQLLGCCLC